MGTDPASDGFWIGAFFLAAFVSVRTKGMVIGVFRQCFNNFIFNAFRKFIPAFIAIYCLMV